MRKVGWIVIGLLLGWILAPALPSAAPLVQNVLLHVGTGASPTALTATSGRLNVQCQ